MSGSRPPLLFSRLSETSSADESMSDVDSVPCSPLILPCSPQGLHGSLDPSACLLAPALHRTRTRTVLKIHVLLALCFRDERARTPLRHQRRRTQGEKHRRVRGEGGSPRLLYRPKHKRLVPGTGSGVGSACWGGGSCQDLSPGTKRTKQRKSHVVLEVPTAQMQVKAP